MVLSALLLAAGMLLPTFEACPWLIFVVAYLPVGLPVLREAYGELRSGSVFNEYTLMLIATIGAFAIGEYPEAVAVMLFYAVGEYFQDLAVGRARGDIRALINLRPDTVTVLTDGDERTTCAPEEVKPGTHIEVRTGERVAVDGRLLSDRTDLDTAALTGESEPRSVNRGEEVPAGTIILGRTARLEVVRPYTESALSRILSQVEDAARRKAPAEKFIRRFARVYTPIVTGLAVLIAVIPPLVTAAAWSEWLYRALVFLVISCPCALVISVPLSYYRGIGVASRRGILFKGGNYLDAITRVGAVLFDKTGTLTRGQFGVADVLTTPGITRDEVITTAAALEQYSTHPVARAVIAALGTTPEAQPQPLTQLPDEVAGLGLTGVVAAHLVVVGKRALLTKEGIDIPSTITESPAYTYIYCARDRQFIGAIALRDEPKADAAQAVKELHDLGIRRVGMLSGDRTPVVEALAHELHIDEAHGDLLPEDKVNRLKAWQNTQAHSGGVAFVGDGINDAPVLATADVGIAMGGAGADAAVETADVVVQGDNPVKVAEAIRLGRKIRVLVTWNISLALGIKAAVLLLGALGLVGLWAAVLADTGVALVCVLNTYLIRK